MHETPESALRRRRRGAALLVAAAGVACAAPAGGTPMWPALQSLSGLKDLLKKVQPPAPAPAPPAPAAAPEAYDPSLMTSRNEAALRALFARGTVNGSELVDELKAMRALMKQKRTPASTGAFLGSPSAGGEAASGGTGFDPIAMAKAASTKKALDTLERKVKPYAASIGLADLDNHMKSIIDDPQRLAGQKIKLPSPQGLSVRQLQRIATMAAIVVATHVTGQVLKKAKEDFANIEGDYLKLLDRREKTATLLYGVLLSGAPGTTELNGVYADADLKFLRDNVARMSVAEFANDMGAQNLALRYLQKTDPTAYADYKARADGTLSSTRGYIRASAGGVAFAGLLAAFVQQSMGILRDRQGLEMLAAFPLAATFLWELPPVLEAAWAAGAAGIVEVPTKASKRFRVIAAPGAAGVELGHSAEVFAAMKKQADAEPIFTEALFRNGGDGLLYKLYRCDRAETGRMLDVAVPLGEREKFAGEYVAKEANGYSFLNAFTVPGDDKREQELGDELLRDDQRQRARRVELGELQRSITGGYGRWGDEQFMRMIFANREGQAAQATLQLGDLRVRPIPSAQSLFVYESLIDGCGQQFGGGRPVTKP